MVVAITGGALGGKRGPINRAIGLDIISAFAERCAASLLTHFSAGSRTATRARVFGPCMRIG